MQQSDKYSKLVSSLDSNTSFPIRQHYLITHGEAPKVICIEGERYFNISKIINNLKNEFGKDFKEEKLSSRISFNEEGFEELVEEGVLYLDSGLVYLYYNRGFIGKEFLDNKIQLKETEVESDSTYNQQIVILYSRYSKDNIIKKIIQIIRNCSSNPEYSAHVNVLYYNPFGELDLKSLYLEEMSFELSLNYGEKFVTIHQKIIDFLNGNSSGLILLHGEPGTGKTTYIQKLISDLKDKKFIFIPGNMISSLSSPNFSEFLISNANSVFVLEDAGGIVSSSSAQGVITDEIANLLNLSDGLTGRALNIKFIISFNSPMKSVDKALLRPGRTIVKHEFKKLNKKDTQRLAEHLGKEIEDNREMTLSEIYNYGNSQGLEEEDNKKIGF